MRSGPSTNHSIINKLKRGVVVEIHGRVFINEQVWYYISFADGPARLYGYVSGQYVGLVGADSDPDFEARLEQEQFPESYRRYLRVLHFLHPNWQFQAFHTGLEWEYVLQGEYK